MIWQAGVSCIAVVVVGIWVARVDRDHPLRLYGIVLLGLLSMFAVGALLWDSPMSGGSMPSLAAAKAPSSPRSVAYVPLLFVLLAAAALGFWPGDSEGPKPLRWIALSIIFAGAALFGLLAAFFAWWGGQGGVVSPFKADVVLAVVICVVSGFGVVKHSS